MDSKLQHNNSGVSRFTKSNTLTIKPKQPKRKIHLATLLELQSKMKIDFSKETLDGRAALVYPGVWVIGELHYAGGLKNTKVNNRAFVMQLTLREDLAGITKGNECLFVHGCAGKTTIHAVKQLEKETGLKAVALLNNGGAHHTYIKLWYDAFPDMKIWVTPTKIPNTANGEFLMQKYSDRWELADNTTTPHHVHQVLKYFGKGNDMQVDCILFNQLYIYKDCKSGAAGIWQHPDQEPKLVGNLYPFTHFAKVIADVSQNTDDTIFFHRKSNVIFTGHLFEFSYVPVRHVTNKELQWEGGFVWSKLMPLLSQNPGRYTTTLGTPGSQRIRNPKIHAEQWQEVMKWDFKYATSHHEPLGICGPISNKTIMDGKGGLKGHMMRELVKSGELYNNPQAGSCFSKTSSNALHNVLKAEQKFRKKFGPLEPQRLGGPKYGPDGFKK